VEETTYQEGLKTAHDLSITQKEEDWLGDRRLAFHLDDDDG